MISPSESGIVEAIRMEEVTKLEFLSMEIPRNVMPRDAGGGNGHATGKYEEVSAPDLGLEQQRVTLELDAARLQGRAEGRRELEHDFEERVELERCEVVRLCNEFRGARENYFRAVEAEVVKLALAIAARVLQREVKLDPMLLRAVVKVALSKVAEESGTVLRVPTEDAPAWRELMVGEACVTVEVAEDARLARGEGVLETVVGRVELGVAAQLDEIEKGFFDLLQQRPV